MKRLILPLLVLLAGTALAWPTLYGPTGFPNPIEYNIANDSTRSAYFSSTDSLYFYTSHYGFYVRQAAATAGDRDIKMLVAVEEDGTEHAIEWDDGNGRFKTTESVAVGTVYATALRSDGAAGVYLTNGTSGNIKTSSAPILLDPNDGGAAVINLGETGDADIVKLNGSEFHTASATYDSTATLAAGVYMCILNQAAGQDTLRLPAAASHTGRMVIIKCVNVNGSLVEGNGAELIDDSNEQALAQWDALQLFCDGTRWLIF